MRALAGSQGSWWSSALTCRASTTPAYALCRTKVLPCLRRPRTARDDPRSPHRQVPPGDATATTVNVVLLSVLKHARCHTHPAGSCSHSLGPAPWAIDLTASGSTPSTTSSSTGQPPVVTCAIEMVLDRLLERWAHEGISGSRRGTASFTNNGLGTPHAVPKGDRVRPHELVTCCVYDYCSAVGVRV